MYLRRIVSIALIILFRKQISNIFFFSTIPIPSLVLQLRVWSVLDGPLYMEAAVSAFSELALACLSTPE